MVRLILLTLLFMPMLAMATGKKPPTTEANAASLSNAKAASSATSKSASNASAKQAQQQQQQQQQQQRQDQANVQTANSSATGGDAIANADINVSADSNYKRNAPAVTVMPSPTTAEMMVCFGLGGSTTNGAATGAWCRLQKELYATHMGDYLASMGDYENGAVAFCSRKLHYRMFNGAADGETECRSQMMLNYRAKYPPVVKLTGPPVEHTHEEFAQCDEKVRRCEAVVVK